LFQAQQQARAQSRAGSALERSAKLRLWEHVREVARDGGDVAYAVPSQSRAGAEHIVVKSRRQSPAQPVWELYTCSCEAARREACIHRAAVFQALYQRRYGGVPVRLPSGAAASASTSAQAQSHAS